MYDYLEAMKEDIKTYILEDINVNSQYSNMAELENALNDDLWTVDSVTGNASGSYTFNRYKAQEYVMDNMELLVEMCSEFGIDNATIGEKFLEEDWEWMDVSIRCYLLRQAISEALNELGENLIFGGDEDNE